MVWSRENSSFSSMNVAETGPAGNGAVCRPPAARRLLPVLLESLMGTSLGWLKVSCIFTLCGCRLEVGSAAAALAAAASLAAAAARATLGRTNAVGTGVGPCHGPVAAGASALAAGARLAVAVTPSSAAAARSSACATSAAAASVVRGMTAAAAL
jgi:hypothetical protein